MAVCEHFFALELVHGQKFGTVCGGSVQLFRVKPDVEEQEEDYEISEDYRPGESVKV